jgi:hypothetical protein
MNKILDANHALGARECLDLLMIESSHHYH